MNIDTYYGFSFFQNEDNELYTLAISAKDKASATALFWKLVRVGTTQINVQPLPHNEFIIGSTEFNPRKIDEIMRFISYYKPSSPKKGNKKH